MVIRRLVRAVVLAGLVLPAAAAELDLAGVWRLTQVGNAKVTCPVRVPGGIHQALLDAKWIADPYYGLNEKNVQWAARERWQFVRNFVVPAEFLSARALTLRMEEVDCFATVKVNGLKAGVTGNRFQRYDFDVRNLVHAGTNTIEVVFDSTEKRSGEESMKYEKADYRRAKTGGRHLQLVRSVLCHGGWDWGLTLVETGLMGPVRLIASDAARLDYVYTTQDFASDYSSVRVTVTADVTAPVAGETRFAAELCGVKAEKAFRLVAGTNRLELALEVEKPRLWWPRGYGESVLHDLAVDVGGVRQVKRIGLRKTELAVRNDAKPHPDSKTGEIGQSLTVVVNGRDVFCQGANWIPSDAIENRQTPARYRDLLGSAAAANMNMIRIWGGGQFEHDAFYDACDELGLLVWHDFLFACTIYPVTDYFMDGVRTELGHQLRRLRDHPSIALWCGDNECITVAHHFAKTKEDEAWYVSLCAEREKKLAAAAREFDPTRPFWTGSPSRGPGDFVLPDGTRGDYHAWGVWFAKMPLKFSFETIPRFCTEMGFQSYPSRELLERYVPANRIDPTTPELHHRQKSKNGDETIAWFIADGFRYPRGVDSCLYLSQVQQAMAIRHAIAAWRPVRSGCSGVVFWQLNDNWPVTSWSLVEYGGKWKQAQYHARRGFAPVAVFAATKHRHKSTFEVRAVNDAAEPFAGTVRVEQWTFGGDVKVLETLPVRLRPHEGAIVKSRHVSSFGGEAKRAQSFLRLRLEGRSGDAPCQADDDWVFEKFRNVDLADAKVAFSVAEGPRPGTFAVRLQSDKPAFYVWANAKGIRGEFDDNSILLLPGEPRTLVFAPMDASVTLARFRAALSVTHLAAETGVPAP